MSTLPRAEYARLYGPTTGDRVRLADTDLWVEVEADDTEPGEELARRLWPRRPGTARWCPPAPAATPSWT